MKNAFEVGKTYTTVGYWDKYEYRFTVLEKTDETVTAKITYVPADKSAERLWTERKTYKIVCYDYYGRSVTLQGAPGYDYPVNFSANFPPEIAAEHFAAAKRALLIYG